MTSSRARLAWTLLMVGLVATLFESLLPNASLRSLVYLFATGLGAAMACLGALSAHGMRRRIWSAVAVAQVLYFAGDLLWEIFDRLLGIEPYPSIADVSYLAGYPVMAAGLVLLAREHGRGAGRAALLDAAIISTGLTIIGVEFLVVPAATADGGNLLSQLVAAAYPVGDLLLMAVLIGVFTSGTARGISFWSLTLGLGMFLFADAEYVLVIVSGAELMPWLDPFWLLGALLVGFAALHPSAAETVTFRRARDGRFTLVRLGFLGGALALVPVTESIRDLRGLDGLSYVVVIGGVLSITLVMVRMWDLVRALQQKSEQLEALARSDSLTGVANRRTWDHELARSLNAAGRHRMPLVVAMIDLDHFKRFNDTHGHVLGDLVLKEAAAGWSEMLEEKGFLARYGGEEFTVILPDVDIEQAAADLDELRRATPHEQTCSIGFALWDGEESVDDLVSRADQALYHAKRHGRNRIAVHDGQQTRDAGRRDPDPALTACAE